MTRRKSIWQRYRQLGTWRKLGVWGALASVAALAYGVLKPPTHQEANINNSPGSTIVQSGRDTVIQQPLSPVHRIQSIVVEGRLTCSLKQGAELPPPEVRFTMLSDGHAYLQGPPGRLRLEFASPVRFHRQEDSRVVVINRFALAPSSDLQQRSISYLSVFEVLQIPSVTVVYGKELDDMHLFEVTMTINGVDAWSYTYPLSAKFQNGILFTIPLEGLKRRLQTLQ